MYNEQDCPEKIYIYLLPEYASKLEEDARNFEILRAGNKINMNSFLNMLVKGYYEQFSNADSFLINANHIDDTIYVKEKRRLVTIRPSKENRSLFSMIVRLHSGHKGVSWYFSKLLMSYCELAMYKREQIIFSDNYKKLKRVTNPQTRSRICFKTKGSKRIHEVIPYKITISKEEMFNYLLCSEIKGGKQVETPFRLTRIDCVDSIPGDTIINEDVERHLIKMEKYAPQYQINEDIETCVRLTDQGVIDYKKIYFGRPERILDKDEIKDNGTYYFFDCSIDQLYLYFRRFGCEAEIIYPEELKNRIKEFHYKALSVYEKE